MSPRHHPTPSSDPYYDFCLSPGQLCPFHPPLVFHPSPLLPAGPLVVLVLISGLFQVELDVRTDSLNLVRSMGQRLLASGYPLASGIRQPLAAVEQELSGLQASWQGRQQQLQQALEQQVGPGQLPASAPHPHQDL